MAGWKDALKADPTDWLLEPDNPSVRYFTLTDILDRPADSPEVSEARVAILDSEDVQAIFARQDPAGWWDTPERATGIKRASGQLLILPPHHPDSILDFSPNSPIIMSETVMNMVYNVVEGCPLDGRGGAPCRIPLQDSSR